MSIRIGDRVKTRMGFVGKIVGLCGDGCARVRFDSTGCTQTYHVDLLTRFVTDAEKLRVYEAAMALHRLRDGCMVYQLQDAERELRDACDEVDDR